MTWTSQVRLGGDLLPPMLPGKVCAETLVLYEETSSLIFSQDLYVLLKFFNQYKYSTDYKEKVRVRVLTDGRK